MPRKNVTKKASPQTERVWSAEEGHELMHQRNPNNLLLKSAELEAKGNFDGAIEAVEKAIEKSPKSTALPSYLDDLLRRRRTHEGVSPDSGPVQKELAPTIT